MPRAARGISSTKIYHIMTRGNNKDTIFLSIEDYDKFWSLIDKKQIEKSFYLYAWCLMPNHAHLLLKEKNETISNAIGSILNSFAYWYNHRYNRIGHIFQDRFKSKPVEDDIYFLRVMRYIHRNPLDGNLCGRMEDYPYSSYAYYFTGDRYKDGDLILNLMKKEDFKQYHFEKDDENDFLNMNTPNELMHEDIINLVKGTGLVQSLSEVNKLSREHRTKVIQTLLQAGVSYRKINEVTGVSLSVIRAISKELHQ